MAYLDPLVYSASLAIGPDLPIWPVWLVQPNSNFFLKIQKITCWLRLPLVHFDTYTSGNNIRPQPLHQPLKVSRGQSYEAVRCRVLHDSKTLFLDTALTINGSFCEFIKIVLVLLFFGAFSSFYLRP